MPESVRLHLARFTLWRLRRRRLLKTITLALCFLASTGVVIFMLTESAFVLDGELRPSLGSALPDTALTGFAPPTRFEARQLGELQAEVLRLRLLFSRIVDSADLNGAEFALSVQMADKRYLDSLSAPENSPEAASQRFELAKRAVDHMTTQAQLMLSITSKRQKVRRFTLSGSPVVRAHITSRYGYRLDPRSGRKRFHRGLDYGGKNGSKVLALADGLVTHSGSNGGYGNLIELEHTGGYRTRYAHNEANLVDVGSKVNKGQVIATMGSTGHSTGTHVHVEVRSQGRAVDPLQYIGAGP